MWVEEEETIQTWVNGGEVILKKVDREYAFRLANEAGDWIEGLPDGMAIKSNQYGCIKKLNLFFGCQFGFNSPTTNNFVCGN